MRRGRQLKGTVVASDAMSCQKAVVDKTIGYGAGYLISLKGNQSGFHEQAASLLERGGVMYPGKIAKQSFVSDWKKVGGRLERRAITMIPIGGLALEWLDKAPEWTGIKPALRAQSRGGGGWRGQEGPD